MELLWLSLIGTVEAIIYLFRYRSATERNPWISAITHLSIASMRIVFIMIGVSAVIAGTPWILAIGAYAIPGTVITFILHEYLERRKERAK